MKTKKILWIILIVIIVLIIFKDNVKYAYHDFQEYLILRKSVVWNPETKLKITDFNFAPNENYIDDFSARVGILSVHRYSGKIIFRSTTVFLPEDSFVSDTTDLHFLRIAQARFNLCEVYRRKLESKINSFNNGDLDKVTKDTILNYKHLYYDQFEKEWDKFNEIIGIKRMEGLEEMENFIEQELNKNYLQQRL